MRQQAEFDFILAGSSTGAETFYVCRPGPERNTWLAYDVGPGGQLTNPRVVFGRDESTGWRGLPELV